RYNERRAPREAPKCGILRLDRRRGPGHRWVMSEKDKAPTLEELAREAKRAKALRDNLRRRKAPSRTPSPEPDKRS
ncbi:MAG TPA: hypothetical protein PKA17_04790, partial [Phenylobacterium sp.]|nr:hypothetical protein [Phenylobacterium sp.]